MLPILVLDAGGTISSAPDGDGALAGGGALAEVLGGAADGVSIRRVFAGLSEEMSLAQACALADEAAHAAGDDAVGGVVVAHGTDTMEESAFLTDLIWRSPKPIVFTGAQRAPGQDGFDGAGNLRDALRLARDPSTIGLGAWIAFGGLAIPARGAFKRHTSDLRAFAHRAGAEAQIGSPLPRLRRPPALPPGRCDERVELIGLGLGATGRIVDGAVLSGARGLVIQGLGRGNCGPDVADAIERAILSGVAVAVASRCPGGEVAPDYVTGRRLAEAGAVFCDDLGASQARILLTRMLALHDQPALAISAVRAWLAACRT